jgi:hypothetical protein
LKINLPKISIQTSFFLSIVYCLDGTKQAWGFLSTPVAKYFPVLLLLFCLLWNIRLCVRKCSLALFISLYVLFGGLYGVIFLNADIQNTFIGRSLSISIIVVGALVAVKKISAEKLVSWLLPVIIMPIFLMLISCLLYAFSWYPFGVQGISSIQLYHTEAFIILSLPYLLRKDYGLKVFVLVGLLAAGAVLATAKATGDVLVMSHLFLMLYLTYLERKGSANKMSFPIIAVLSVAIFCATTFALYRVLLTRIGQFGEYNDWRLQSIEVLLERFWLSPYFGDFFIGNPLVTIQNVELPSHFDLLDLFLHGGLGWFLPFLWVVVRAGLHGRYAIRSHGGKFFVSLAFFGTIVIMVNPMLTDPHISIFLMFSIGYLSYYDFAEYDSERVK